MSLFDSNADVIHDGFLCLKIKRELDETIKQRTLEIVNLIIQGKRQNDTGKLELNAVEASTRYLQFAYYLSEKKLWNKQKEVLFDLQNFTGNYLDYWTWFLNKCVSEVSRRHYRDVGL